jgi:hypothetical protein
VNSLPAYLKSSMFTPSSVGALPFLRAEEMQSVHQKLCMPSVALLAEFE